MRNECRPPGLRVVALAARDGDRRVSTSGCVRASATDATQHGFRPIVVADACGDRTAAVHDANLFDLEAKDADVPTVAEAVTRFASPAARRPWPGARRARRRGPTPR